MSSKLTTIKAQLTDLAPVINQFSEPVQGKIIDRLLDVMFKPQAAVWPGDKVITNMQVLQATESKEPRKPGATKILNEVIKTDFFKEARTIAAIAVHCREAYDADFATSELSGILMKMVADGKLTRTQSPENNRFVYQQTQAA